MNALSDRDNYSRAISNTCKCEIIPLTSSAVESTAWVVRLDIPVISIDNIGVGISVEKSNVESWGEAEFNLLHSVHFSLTVSNNSKHYNYDAVKLRKIQRWGITNKLSIIKFSPLQGRLILDEFLLDEDMRIV